MINITRLSAVLLEFRSMKILLSILSVLAVSATMAQPSFNLTIEEVPFAESPGVHSFAMGQHDGKWLIVGGRTDGLHRRQPWAAFLPEGSNVNAYVIDPVSLNVWAAPLSALPNVQFEQLQSTNMEFTQRDTVLYIMGGYGRSEAQNDHVTHAVLTAVNLPSAITAIISGTPIAQHFRHIVDGRMAVTGGYLHHLDGYFYQVGGQYFEGRYNPQGPNSGPGFIQNYTEAIQKFRIEDDGSALNIAEYTTTVDAANLHRRDYNLVPQIFPDGTHGFTAFTGVFQHDADLPWLNTVDILPDSYAVNNDFNQLLNQYHSALLPVHDGISNQMHTLFFGGIGRYYFDPQSGTLIDDPAVPFVKTISLVTRDSDGMMTETALPMEMPSYLGSGAEFIPLKSLQYINGKILILDELPVGLPTLVGHVFGGIESSARNIFFVNDGTQSHASNRLFKVFIERTTTSVSIGTVITGREVFRMNLYPNPVSDVLTVELSAPFETRGILSILSMNGQTVRKIDVHTGPQSHKKVAIDCTALPAGHYVVRFDTGAFYKEDTVIIKK